MQLSQSQKNLVNNAVSVVTFSIRWGFVPLVVVLGFKQGADPLPNGQAEEKNFEDKEKRLLMLREVHIRNTEAAAKEEKCKKEKKPTFSISIAIPGSFLNNAQSAELRAYMAGQIARAATLFCTKEIIVYDETSKMTKEAVNAYWSGAWSGDIYPAHSNYEACFHLAKILEYLECPQYLRKRLFPFHKALKFAGLLNPLDAQHHLKAENLSVSFREGVVLNRPVRKGRGPLVDIGLEKEFQVDEEIQLPPDTRVTVEIKNITDESKRFHGSISSAKKVKERTGLYWGYSVKIATSLQDVFDRKKYDTIIGTSSKGSSVSELQLCALNDTNILIVFGGVEGVDAALESEESLEYFKAEEAFNHLVNCLPHKGTRTERVEENVMVTLSEISMRLEQLFS